MSREGGTEDRTGRMPGVLDLGLIALAIVYIAFVGLSGVGSDLYSSTDQVGDGKIWLLFTSALDVVSTLATVQWVLLAAAMAFTIYRLGPCDRFSLQGSGMKGLRATVKRASKELTFRMIRESEATPILCDQLNEIRERWRGDSDERGFTMDLGTDVEGENPDFLLSIAVDVDERPQGFLRLVPVFGDDPGWSLDLMQRNPDSPNGITEFLIANCATTLGQQGFRRLSMNFAAWGRLFDDEASLSLGQKVMKRCAEVMNPFFQIKSLRDFNAKFDPDWWPRSIVVEDVESAPKVGLLYATTEGFLKIPVIGKKLVPPLRAQSRD